MSETNNAIPENSALAEENIVANSNAGTSLPEQIADENPVSISEELNSEVAPTENENEEGQNENQLIVQFDILKANQEQATELLYEILSQTKDAARSAEKKQEQIDKLYNENQEYKQGIHERLKKSLILAVIEQIDAALKQIAHFENQEFSEENYRKLLANYNEIATDFQDSLAQSFDVVAFNCEENTPFDAKRQKALKTVPVENESKHKTISKSLRPGYEMSNTDGTTTLLRLEMVEVFVHQSNNPNPN